VRKKGDIPRLFGSTFAEAPAISRRAPGEASRGPETGTQLNGIKLSTVKLATVLLHRNTPGLIEGIVVQVSCILLPGSRAGGDVHLGQLRSGVHAHPNLIGQSVDGFRDRRSFRGQADRKAAGPGHAIPVAGDRLNDDRNVHRRSPRFSQSPSNSTRVVTGREANQEPSGPRQGFGQFLACVAAHGISSRVPDRVRWGPGRHHPTGR
jgi:hypothetical protein